MPRRSAKRTRHDVTIQSTTAPPVPESELTRLDGPANTTGLLGLPVEVFARIYDELLVGSRLITQDDAMSGAQYLNGKTIECPADILRPLTQTCRVLRSMYLPVVYEHTEAWIVRGKGQWYKQLGDRLESVCNRFARSPEHAKLVQ